MTLGNGDRHRVLYAVFSLSRANLRVDVDSIGRAAGLDANVAAEALRQLERAGLVDGTGARLTMAGLAVAVSTSARVARRRRPPP